MEEKQTPPATPDDENALEAQTSADDENALESSVVDATGNAPLGGGAPASPAAKPKAGFKQKLSRFNLYFVLFLFILVIAAGIATVAYFQSKKASTVSTLKAQTLTQQTLMQVANSDATIGSASEVLNVESSAVFAGQVLLRAGLQIAGDLQVGGAINAASLNASGTSSLGQVSVAKNISVAGTTALQGAVSIASNLQVSGTASFGGNITAPQIATSGLQLNSDLVLTHHVTTGGGTPNRTTGPALGSGGSASVGGSDTGGSVTINTGNNPPAGCFVTITFTSKYAAVPHVLLTPVGSAGGGIAYYVNRDVGGFSICDASAPPSGASFGFDYFVID